MGVASALLKPKARTKQETVAAPHAGENQMRGLDFGEGALVRQEKIDLDDIYSWTTSKTNRRQQTRTRGARSLKKTRTNKSERRVQRNQHQNSVVDKPKGKADSLETAEQGLRSGGKQSLETIAKWESAAEENQTRRTNPPVLEILSRNSWPIAREVKSKQESQRATLRPAVPGGALSWGETE
jgi:hypothetical protein